jgi:hypothetical protein
MQMRSIWCGALACCVSLSSFGCAGDAHSNDDGAEGAQAETTASDEGLLAKISLSETHSIEFREPLPGELMVLEQFHVDRDRGAVARDFDASKQSVTAFYRQLAGRSATPEALAALQAFEARALPFDAPQDFAAEPGPAPEIVRAAHDKATTATPPGWNFLNEFAWFSSNFCRIDSTNDRCFINLESFNEVQVANSVRGALFNQDFDVRAQMLIRFDPCFNQVIGFCTQSFKNLQKLDLAPRTALNSSIWSNRNRYGVLATGRHIGVFVDYR